MISEKLFEVFPVTKDRKGTGTSLIATLLLSVEDTAHVTIEHRLTNLLFLLFYSFFCPFVLYCFTSSVSSKPEHGTSRNIPEHRIIMRKICKIKFSKTEKTSNLEAARLKLHKCYHFMILL